MCLGRADLVGLDAVRLSSAAAATTPAPPAVTTTAGASDSSDAGGRERAVQVVDRPGAQHLGLDAVDDEDVDEPGQTTQGPCRGGVEDDRGAGRRARARRLQRWRPRRSRAGAAGRGCPAMAAPLCRRSARRRAGGWHRRRRWQRSRRCPPGWPRSCRSPAPPCARAPGRRRRPPGRSRSRAPNSSSPRQPTIRTAAPWRAAATAWLAPLPPCFHHQASPMSVSPVRGR